VTCSKSIKYVALTPACKRRSGVEDPLSYSNRPFLLRAVHIITPAQINLVEAVSRLVLSDGEIELDLATGLQTASSVASRSPGGDRKMPERPSHYLATGGCLK